MEIFNLFGGATVWLVGLVLLYLAALLTIGFAQGREVAFWPPRLGPRPAMRTDEELPGADVEQQPFPQQLVDAHIDRATSSISITPQSGTSLFDTEYDTAHALDFYQAIAERYDLRNSSDLLRTHQAVVSRIRQLRNDNEMFHVLDLGGGTGKQIATQFFDDNSIHWTYVDFCAAMVSQFQANIAGTPFEARTDVIVADVARVHERLHDRKFDVVLLALLLSSMPHPPDFQKLVSMLKPGGHIVIADISPVYTALNPYYAVMINSHKAALKTNPVNPFALSHEAAQVNLVRTELEGIGQAQQSYSFIEVFQLRPRKRVRVVLGG